MVIERITGTAAVPWDGKGPYRFKRSTKHACKDPDCPIDGGHLAAFDRNPARAMLVSRGLWEVWNKPTLICPFAIHGRIVQLENESFEQSLYAAEPSALASLRALLEKHDKPLVQLTSIGMIFCPDKSPGELWLARGGAINLQAFAEPGRQIFEDDSWLGGRLESPEDLIPDEDDDDEDDGEGDDL